MTYSTGVPDANASPGAFPAQGQTNFTRLKTIISANHAFNDGSSSDDGYHELVEWNTTASASVSASSILQTFANQPTANIGTLLFNNCTNSNAALSGFKGVMAPIGNVTGLSIGASSSTPILDLTGITYLDAIISVSGLLNSTFNQRLVHFSYDGTFSTITNFTSGVTSNFQVSFSSPNLIIQNINATVGLTNVYWSMQIMRIAPLA